MWQIEAPTLVQHVLVRVHLRLIVHSHEVSAQIAFISGQNEDHKDQPEVVEKANGEECGGEYTSWK